MSRTVPELVDIIKRASDQYWKTGVSFLSDPEYDRIVEELRKLDPGNPILHKIEGLEPDQKVHHPTPMLSLQKAYSLEEIDKWCATLPQATELTVMPKYDGIAGRWDGITLSTRGNGYEGENITSKLQIIRTPQPWDIKNNPTLVEPFKATFQLTERGPCMGEILMPLNTFKEFQKEAAKLGIEYKTPRNATAGLLNAKEIPEELLQVMLEKQLFLALIPYDMWTVYVSNNISESLFDTVQEMLSPMLDLFPCDGIVFRATDDELFKSLGATSHHPKGAIAYKFQNESAETVLTGVEWSQGKEALTPVALFKPVTLGSVQVSRASLHNMKNIISMGLHIGDTISVERAGDVIPYVADCTAGETRTEIKCPDCPVCGWPTQYEDPELVCSNPDCSGKIVQRLLATSRVLEVDNLAQATIEKIVKAYGVHNWAQMLDLTVEQLQALPGFGERSARKLKANLDKSRLATPEAFLALFNIKGIGKSIAKLILNKVALGMVPYTSESTLQSIPGVGPARAKTICEFFASPSNQDLWATLLLMIRIKREESPASAKTICFTGKMEMPRSYYEALAKEKGYMPVDSVTKSLTVLVTSDMTSTSTKMKKAESLGIPIESLDMWLNE